MATKSRLPSIPVRTPKNRFQSEQDEMNKIGQRVTIPSLDNITGTLRYVGEPAFKSGIWAGIEVDKQGEGKNDGSVQGKRYFSCAPNTGIFIGINKIIIHPPTTTSSNSNTTTTNATALPTRKSNLPLTRHISRTPSTSTSTSTSTTTTTKKRVVRTSSIPSTTQEKSPTLQPIKRSTITPTTTTIPYQKSPSPSLTTKRSTITPTTSSTLSSPTPPPPAPPMTRKKSTPSPPIVDNSKEETNQLYNILEKVQKERDTLLSQMKNKETAWERLVSSKESLLLKVEEEEMKSRRLERELEEERSQLQQIQLLLEEKEELLAKNQRNDEKSIQDGRRIERLENLTRELQNEIKEKHEIELQNKREQQGAMDQVRKEVQASEKMAASLEKECEELRRAGLEAIHAYEHSVIQLNEKHAQELQQKQHIINSLEFTINDLKHKTSTLFDDDEKDIETRLKEMQQTHFNVSNTQEQRQRLEEQLELTMTELDSERHLISTLNTELDQLKKETTSLRQQVIQMEQKYDSLQNDFEKELQDKKRLIEEADNAFEQQAKAEDEHYQLKLSYMSIEKEFNQLTETHKQLELDYNQLMDDMLVLEKQDLTGNNNTGTTTTTKTDNKQVVALQKELETYKQNLSLKSNQVTQLSKELAELESLVENRVFGESDLEEQLEEERKKNKLLQRELNNYKQSSPITTPTHHQEEEDLNEYCDLCERYGHNLLQCKSTKQQLEKLYCDNCDDYGNHTTDDCPNQDETF